MRDECGRTPLDLALVMFEDLLITSLCTSFPVDFLVRTLEYDARFPSKFVPHYADAYANLNDHPNALRLAAGREGGIAAQYMPEFEKGAPSEYPRFAPVPFPSYKHDALPTHVYETLTSPAVGFQPRRAGKKTEAGNQIETERAGKELSESEQSEGSGESDNMSETSVERDLEASITVASLRPPNASKLQKLYQDQMVIVVEDAIQQPTPSRVKRRLNELISQMRALNRAINLLMTCEPLRVLAIEYRLTKSGTPDQQKKESGRVPKFVLEHLTYPYLFMATLQVIIVCN